MLERDLPETCRLNLPTSAQNQQIWQTEVRSHFSFQNPYSLSSISHLTEPTKEEETVAGAKEAEEQAGLSYNWTQTISDSDVTLEVPRHLRAKNLNVDIKKKKSEVKIKGKELLKAVRLLPHQERSYPVADPFAPTNSSSDPGWGL